MTREGGSRWYRDEGSGPCGMDLGELLSCRCGVVVSSRDALYFGSGRLSPSTAMLGLTG